MKSTTTFSNRPQNQELQKPQQLAITVALNYLCGVRLLGEDAWMRRAAAEDSSSATCFTAPTPAASGGDGHGDGRGGLQMGGPSSLELEFF
jgi:GH24 family phage-related lysozyme (muramidase)